MRKIEVTRESIWLKHDAFCQLHIVDKILKLKTQELARARPRPRIIADYERFTREAVKELTHAEPNELKTVFDKYNEMVVTETAAKKVKKVFLSAYAIFTKIDNTKWGAYQYLKELDISICPYCNENFTYRLLKNERRSKNVVPNITIRADLDHFHPKTDYQFLAVSLYNLVPSCKVCNSSVKGAFEFVDEKKPLNPYQVSLDEQFKFVKKPRDERSAVDTILGYSIEFDFMVEPKSKSAQIESARYMLDFFGVLDRYNHQHKDYIQRQVRRELAYDPTLKENMDIYLESLNLGSLNTYLERRSIGPLEVKKNNVEELDHFDIANQSLGKLMNDSFGEIRDYHTNNENSR